MTVEMKKGRSEDSIIADVLKKARGTPGNNPESEPNVALSTFRYGRKRLNMWAYSFGRFYTYVDSVNDEESLDRETSIVYKAAQIYMQETVNRIGRAYTYTLRTKNEKMRDWANGPGKEIFHWSTIKAEPTDEKRPFCIFEAQIVPESPDAKT